MEELYQNLLSVFVLSFCMFNSFISYMFCFLSKALENGDAALSDSEALTESESDVTSDSTLSDSISNKESSIKTEGKKKIVHR